MADRVSPALNPINKSCNQRNVILLSLNRSEKLKQKTTIATTDTVITIMYAHAFDRKEKDLTVKKVLGLQIIYLVIKTNSKWKKVRRAEGDNMLWKERRIKVNGKEWVSQRVVCIYARIQIFTFTNVLVWHIWNDSNTCSHLTPCWLKSFLWACNGQTDEHINSMNYIFFYFCNECCEKSISEKGKTVWTRHIAPNDGPMK